MQKIKKLLIDNLKWIILFICVITLLFLIEDVMDEDIMKFDENGYYLVSRYLFSDKMTVIEQSVTNFGGMYWLIGLSIFLLIVIKNKRISISIFLNLGLSALTNFTLKQLLQRERPMGYRIIDESGYSLPSGHSMVSMAYYGFLIYLIYKYVKNKYIKWTLIVLLSLLIVNIGVSRIYLGVHYTSDVIAGFLVAITYLIIFTNFIKNYINKPEEKKM